MRRKGFSLPELSMAILVTMILASVVVVQTDGMLDQAKYSRAKGEMANLAGAVTRYRYDMKAYPANLAALTNASPYGDGAPWITASMFPVTDPWGNNCGGGAGYCYISSATSFAIWTMGSNGANNSGGTLPSAFSGDDSGLFGK